jgi:hypothetical protein
LGRIQLAFTSHLFSSFGSAIRLFSFHGRKFLFVAAGKSCLSNASIQVGSGGADSLHDSRKLGWSDPAGGGDELAGSGHFAYMTVV